MVNHEARQYELRARKRLAIIAASAVLLDAILLIVFLILANRASTAATPGCERYVDWLPCKSALATGYFGLWLYEIAAQLIMLIILLRLTRSALSISLLTFILQMIYISFTSDYAENVNPLGALVFLLALSPLLWVSLSWLFSERQGLPIAEIG